MLRVGPWLIVTEAEIWRHGEAEVAAMMEDYTLPISWQPSRSVLTLGLGANMQAGKCRTGTVKTGQRENQEDTAKMLMFWSVYCSWTRHLSSAGAAETKSDRRCVMTCDQYSTVQYSTVQYSRVQYSTGVL